MLKVNLARVLVVSAVMIAGSAGMALPAQAQDGELMYERYYYSDAAHSQQVGYERDTCHLSGVGGGPTQGIETPYFDSFPFAVCDHGNVLPY